MTRQNASVYEDHNKLEKQISLFSDTYDIYVYKKYARYNQERKAVGNNEKPHCWNQRITPIGTGTIRKEFLEFVANIEKGNPDPIRFLNPKPQDRYMRFSPIGALWAKLSFHSMSAHYPSLTPFES